MNHRLLARLLLITGGALPTLAACDSSQDDSNTAQTNNSNGGSSQAGAGGSGGSGGSGQAGSAGSSAGAGGVSAGAGGSSAGSGGMMAGSGGSDAGAGGSDAGAGGAMAGSGGSDAGAGGSDAGAGGSAAGSGGSAAGTGGSAGAGGTAGVPCVEGGACVEDAWCGDSNVAMIKHCVNGAYQSATENFTEIKVCIEKAAGETCLMQEDIELYPAVTAEYNASCLGVQGPSEPQVQKASNGVERCCYQVFAVCVGRPLFLGGGMRLAALRNDAFWG